MRELEFMIFRSDRAAMKILSASRFNANAIERLKFPYLERVNWTITGLSTSPHPWFFLLDAPSLSDMSH